MSVRSPAIKMEMKKISPTCGDFVPKIIHEQSKQPVKGNEKKKSKVKQEMATMTAKCV